MKNVCYSALFSLIVLVSLTGCAHSPQKETAMKYPRKPADNPERKSGLPMLFYEEAEKDADVNDVVVIPPAEKKQDGLNTSVDSSSD